MQFTSDPTLQPCSPLVRFHPCVSSRDPHWCSSPARTALRHRFGTCPHSLNLWSRVEKAPNLPCACHVNRKLTRPLLPEAVNLLPAHVPQTALLRFHFSQVSAACICHPPQVLPPRAPRHLPRGAAQARPGGAACSRVKYFLPLLLRLPAQAQGHGTAPRSTPFQIFPPGSSGF